MSDTEVELQETKPKDETTTEAVHTEDPASTTVQTTATPPSDDTPAKETASPYTGFLLTVDKFFEITERGSNYRTECIAGLTTYVAMVYIFMVNSDFFSIHIPYGAAYIATGVPSIIGTLLMAFIGKMPLAMAPGMGVNAFICITLLLLQSNEHLTYPNTLIFVLLDGIIFIILTATGLRKKIFEAIPTPVKSAVPVGIGLFIAFIGFQQSAIIIGDPEGTLVKFTSFNVLADNPTFFGYTGNVIGMLPALTAFLGLLCIGIFAKRHIKGEIIFGILIATVFFYVFGGIAAGAGSRGAKDYFKSIKFENPFKAFADWGKESLAVVFYKGFDFSHYSEGTGSLILKILTTALSLCMIDMFDTIGTLYGACAKGNLLDETGTPIRMNQMMLSDAIATCIGALCGTSTVTTFVESSSGVSAGGRTGFASVITSCLFFITLFLSPIAKLIPRSATASALIWVGVLMMMGITRIDWETPDEALISFMSITITAFGYSISTGIGIGILFFIVCKICTGAFKEISIPTWVIGVLFFATFILTD